MTSQQEAKFDSLEKLQLKTSNTWFDYWHQYSSFGTWQFWVSLGLILIPLLILYIFMDKRKALLLGFYGYNIHVWFGYADAFGSSRNLWSYPYKLLPILPGNFSLDAAFTPIVYMLAYQWVLTHKKNYYIYMIGVSTVLAFFIEPILDALGLLELHRGTNPFHLLLVHITVMLIAKCLTELFILFEKSANSKQKLNYFNKKK